MQHYHFQFNGVRSPRRALRRASADARGIRQKVQECRESERIHNAPSSLKSSTRFQGDAASQDFLRWYRVGFVLWEPNSVSYLRPQCKKSLHGKYNKVKAKTNLAATSLPSRRGAQLSGKDERERKRKKKTSVWKPVHEKRLHSDVGLLVRGDEADLRFASRFPTFTHA